jgi:hypothetical protein
MASRISPASAALGLLSLFGAAGTAEAQGPAGRAADVPIVAESGFLTDFHTIYECLERVALDDGLSIQFRGTGSGWRRRGPLDGPFLIVADEQRFPFLRDGVLRRDVRRVPGQDAKGGEWRKIEVDLDTGELTGPEGVDLKGLEMTSLRLHFTLKRTINDEPCQVELAREYSDKHIKVSISKGGEDGRAFSRDLMASLESKLILASKLREARKKARHGEQREKRGSERKEGEPMPTSPERPKSPGAPG